MCQTYYEQNRSSEHLVSTCGRAIVAAKELTCLGNLRNGNSLVTEDILNKASTKVRLATSISHALIEKLCTH